MSLCLQINQAGSWRRVVDITNLDAGQDDLHQAVEYLTRLAPNSRLRLVRDGDEVLEYFVEGKLAENPYRTQPA